MSCQAGADFLVVADCKEGHLVQSAATWRQTNSSTMKDLRSIRSGQADLVVD